MSESSKISWTNDTFNPWWGCHKVSEECENCYAESTADRFHPGHWGFKAPRWFFSDKHWNEPRRWNARAWREGVRHRVFCASMADVFELHPVDEIRRQQDEARARLWGLINDTPYLDWLLLTKRPENFAEMLPWKTATDRWPTVWLGVTAGVRKSLYRIDTLNRTPAVVRFVSCEPILEHITEDDWDNTFSGGGINWLIVGDESGKKRRSANPDWVRAARNSALRNKVAFHFKQWAGDPQSGIEGERTAGRDGKIHLPVLDGEKWAEVPR